MFAPEGDGCLQRAKREDAGRFSKEGKSLDDFWYFWSRKSTIREKFLYDFSRANNVRPLSRRRQHTCFAYVLIPLQAKTRVQQTSRIKDLCPIRFFFCIYRRKRKCYQKENAVVELSRSAERDKGSAL